VLNYGLLVLLEGSEITGNRATTAGGGVCNSGTFLMGNGTIHDNTAKKTATGAALPTGRFLFGLFDATERLIATFCYPEGPPAFTNRFAPALVVLEARKVACGACLPENFFRFGVFDPGGAQVATALNDRCGNIVFPALCFSQTGTYHLTVREIGPASEGWVADQRVYPVTICVEENHAKELTARVDYPGGQPYFVNHFLWGSCCSQRVF